MRTRTTWMARRPTRSRCRRTSRPRSSGRSHSTTIRAVRCSRRRNATPAPAAKAIRLRLRSRALTARPPCISVRPSLLACKTAIGFRQRRARASTSCSAYTARSKHFSQSSGGQARSNWRNERRNHTEGSMKTIGIRILLTAALAGTPAFTTAQAQQSLQVPIPKSAAEVSGPVSGTLMTNEYVQMVGRTAYFWGYPIVATSSRRDAFAKAPERIYLGGFLPMAPIGELTMLHDYISPDQSFIVCPNQDVVYGGGFAALDKELMVFQVPDFGKRFWVYPIYDNRTDEIGRIGQQYGTKPGFYMIVGPNWKDKIPAGITAIVRSSTDLAFPIPRIQLDDTAEDRQAIQAPLSQVMFYPLSQFDG